MDKETVLHYKAREIEIEPTLFFNVIEVYQEKDIIERIGMLSVMRPLSRSIYNDLRIDYGCDGEYELIKEDYDFLLRNEICKVFREVKDNGCLRSIAKTVEVNSFALSEMSVNRIMNVLTDLAYTEVNGAISNFLEYYNNKIGIEFNRQYTKDGLAQDLEKYEEVLLSNHSQMSEEAYEEVCGVFNILRERLLEGK